MKRHVSLVPLSREHHEGLVMAQRLILGRSTNPGAAWPSEPEQQVGRLLEFFGTALGRHFDLEERHLFPLVIAELADRDATAQTLITGLTKDHGAMRAMIREFEEDPTTRLDTRLPAFGKRLRGHIQTEERELFERIQAVCSPEVLAELEKRIAVYVAERLSACNLSPGRAADCPPKH